MTLSAPTKLVFIIAVVLAILALVIQLGVFSIGIPAFWIMTAGLVVLAAGSLLKGV